MLPFHRHTSLQRHSVTGKKDHAHGQPSGIKRDPAAAAWADRSNPPIAPAHPLPRRRPLLGGRLPAFCSATSCLRGRDCSHGCPARRRQKAASSATPKGRRPAPPPPSGRLCDMAAPPPPPSGRYALGARDAPCRRGARGRRVTAAA